MSDDRFEELLREARQLPEYSPLRIAVLEEAIREADRLEDAERGYRARSELVRIGTFSGFEDRALVAFSWCLSHADRLGDEFDDTYSLMWSYKWIARSITDFPQVSREQIRNMEDDLAGRFERLGYDRRPLLKIRWSNALDMGDLERAREIFAEWQETPRGFMSDCHACDENSIVHFHSAFDENEQAIRRAAPILAGDLTCASVPHATFGHLLEPLARLERFDEADDFANRGYRMISRNRDYLGNLGDYVTYHVHRGNWDRAVRIVERHLPWTLESTDPASRHTFDRAAWMLFARLVDRGDRIRKLRTPDDFPLSTEDDRHRPSDLAAWFGERARESGRRFDERNGNDSYQQGIVHEMAFTGVQRDTP